MSVRRATPEDLDEVVRIGAAFHAACPYSHIPLDCNAFREFCERLIDGGVIFLTENGFIGGVLSPLYFNPSVVSAAELFWFSPDGGSDLRAAFENWAQEVGAQIIQFSGLVNDREAASRRLFRRMGYKPTEVGFIKRVA